MSANANFGPYSVAIVNQSVSTAITIVQVRAGSNRRLAITRAWCSQSNLTASGQQRIQILRKSTAATVTAFTPILLNPVTVAADAVGSTTGTGTIATNEGVDGDVLVHDAFNWLNGWLWVPIPEERIIVPTGGAIALKFPAAPNPAATVTAGFTFYEF